MTFHLKMTKFIKTSYLTELIENLLDSNLLWKTLLLRLFPAISHKELGKIKTDLSSYFTTISSFLSFIDTSSYKDIIKGDLKTLSDLCIDFSIEYAKIMYENVLVLEEIKSIPDEVRKEDKVGRIDKTNECIVTIDSEDAKDLDDAISVKKLDDGTYMLSVYIADVSHYVKEDTNLDKEAVKRGTSIYIPGTVIPMLPKKLSNGICSLNAGVERLALAVDMKIDKNGNIVENYVYKAVIKVSKKMSYEKVYKVLMCEDLEVLKEYKEYEQNIFLMKELAEILKKRRKEEGCIDFDIPDTKVILDDERNVVDIKPYDVTIANKIIEEFMLITNMTIAEKFYFLEAPFIYRIHEKPDEEKLRMLNVASVLEDLKIPPSNHLESLTGDRQGQYSIRINNLFF